MQELQDAVPLLRGECVELPDYWLSELDAVGHDVSSLSSVRWCALRRCEYVPGCVPPGTGLPDPLDVRGSLRGHSRFWYARCAGPASRGVLRSTAEVELPAWYLAIQV